MSDHCDSTDNMMPENRSKWPADRLGRDYSLRTYTYPRERDIVFVLGAGASYAEGAPLQKGIIPMILSDDIPEIRRSALGRMIVDFISDNFGYDSSIGVYPSLESIFGFLDYFINTGVSLSARYSNIRMYYIKEGLIKLIHYVFAAATREKTKDVYRRFWRMISSGSRNVSIITLNFDTLLEDAFGVLYPDYAYIDYCIPLMNYDMPDYAGYYSRWIDPRSPFPVWSGGNPVPIKIMKIHGSINWKFCRCCNQVLLTPWDKDINLEYEAFPRFLMSEDDLSQNSINSGRDGILPERLIRRSEKYFTTPYQCPVDSTRFETLIIPPSHMKNLCNPVISQMFAETIKELHSARQVVFIGYSFPEADIHFRATLCRALMGQEKKITVIDSDSSEEYRMKSRPFSGNTRYVTERFENLVEGDMLKNILENN